MITSLVIAAGSKAAADLFVSGVSTVIVTYSIYRTGRSRKIKL